MISCDVVEILSSHIHALQKSRRAQHAVRLPLNLHVCVQLGTDTCEKKHFELIVSENEHESCISYTTCATYRLPYNFITHLCSTCPGDLLNSRSRSIKPSLLSRCHTISTNKKRPNQHAGLVVSKTYETKKIVAINEPKLVTLARMLRDTTGVHRMRGDKINEISII